VTLTSWDMGGLAEPTDKIVGNLALTGEFKGVNLKAVWAEFWAEFST